MVWDALIAGAGPAGSAAAAFAAQAGLRVLVLERAVFPRGKVCGDCLNPLAWPVLERLGAAPSVAALPHALLETASITAPLGVSFRHRRGPGRHPFVALKRSLLDDALARHATRCGASFFFGSPLTALRREGGLWKARSGGEWFKARRFVAADGRNSTALRLLGLLPQKRRGGRVALQTHVRLPKPGNAVCLHLLTEGYCGTAPVDGETLNVCLVGLPPALESLRAWAAARYGASPEAASWRTVAPLSRPPLPPAGVAEGLVLAGDAAVVVEPFTGEGIYYALASGELAAAHLAGALSAARLNAAHRRLYAGRLWVNRLARLAVRHPGAAGVLLRALGAGPLGYLTRRVIG